MREKFSRGGAWCALLEWLLAVAAEGDERPRASGTAEERRQRLDEFHERWLRENAALE